MATAEELLLGARAASTNSREHPFAVSEDLRTVDVPGGQGVLGSRHDDATRLVWFSLPRYSDGMDLSGYAVSVMYRNALGDLDRSMAREVEVGDDRIVFAWLVGATACAGEGTVTASVNLREYGADGVTVEREFNTTTFEMEVLESVQADEASVSRSEDRVAALVAGWESRVAAAISSIGERAAAGEFDGASPSASVERTASGALITVTDSGGTTTAEVRDGARGEAGPSYSPATAEADGLMSAADKALLDDIGEWRAGLAQADSTRY